MLYQGQHGCHSSLWTAHDTLMHLNVCGTTRRLRFAFLANAHDFNTDKRNTTSQHLTQPPQTPNNNTHSRLGVEYGHLESIGCEGQVNAVAVICQGLLGEGGAQTLHV